MPRIRTLKPEHKQHRKVGPLSDRAYRLWVGLITEADDAGRLTEDVRQLKALIFGFQDATKPRHVRLALEEIESTGLIQRYSVNEVAYIALPSWADHQRINRPTPSRIPPPPLIDDSLSAHGPLTPDRILSDLILSDRKGSDLGSEGLSEKDRPPSSPPTPRPVASEGRSAQSNGTDPEPPLDPQTLRRRQAELRQAKGWDSPEAAQVPEAP